MERVQHARRLRGKRAGLGRDAGAVGQRGGGREQRLQRLHGFAHGVVVEDGGWSGRRLRSRSRWSSSLKRARRKILGVGVGESESRPRASPFRNLEPSSGLSFFFIFFCLTRTGFSPYFIRAISRPATHRPSFTTISASTRTRTQMRKVEAHTTTAAPRWQTVDSSKCSRARATLTRTSPNVESRRVAHVLKSSRNRRSDLFPHPGLPAHDLDGRLLAESDEPCEAAHLHRAITARR